ncbi:MULTISPECIES: ribonuclease P [Streptococcus]|jgi:sakacin A production response regulator|uniref:Ribonuclease P n=1 Tax=Streptococcus salivarius TaxID=1304 RepID=A0AA45HUN3_STRSL|nr:MULTISPECIES: ribonuclease P [Streptococcus]MBK5044758.1 ribonuclease P [Streptococcus sp. 2.1]MBK5161169.1 ribonuclease P [Streptococcus sp. 3.1]PZD56883.1 ribonuclease P [Streptococcus salivarius]
MLENIKAYLSKQGVKYIKPEKAGPHQEEMEMLKALGQAARKEMQTLSKVLEERLAPFKVDRVSNWANQAQICRPHFWCYYRAPEDSLDDVAMAIRLYGQPEKWGISVEVSFVERKKSDTTLAKQHKVLDLPIAPSLYYFAQEDGVSHRVEGTEENRQMLKAAVRDGRIRKVLVKYDVVVTTSKTMEELVEELADGFDKLKAYYEKANKN